MSEAKIHFELYRYLQNAIERGAGTEEVKFGDVKPEKGVNGGWADVVVYDQIGDPVLVIEAKRKDDGSAPTRDIDPYSPKVIKQAADYATTLGAPYFATYNGDHCVIHETFQAGTHLLDRRTSAYSIQSPRDFAGGLLQEINDLERGEARWDPHHRAFTNRLRVYHQRLSESFEERIEDRIKEDTELKEQWETWVSEQGWEDDYDYDPEEVYRRYAMQAAYLLMNKLVFYKLLEDTDAYDVPQILMRDLVDPEMRRETFDNLIEVLDFEAVYENDPIFDALPLTELMQVETGELLEQLEEFNLGAFDHDVIGQIYQEIIPAEERHELGQYYTPPEVVDLICRLTIGEEDDMILDPGCGSGGFLVNAYQRLSELKDDGEHQEILDQLKGFDINRFPAHLSAINLAIQNLEKETRNVGVEIEDFFLVNPNQVRMAFGSQASTGGDGEPGTNEIEAFDAVIGNPPYIRQEQIADKKRCRRHLSSVGADLGSRSDIYSYFFTHGTRFLKEGGRLGFITSDRWLSVKYGEDLQDFLLEKFKIKAIINFTRQQFELPLISTCVVILERCSDARERDSNVVQMLQLKEPAKAESITELLEEEREANQIKDKDEHRLVTLRQEDLKEEDKWGRFLWAPPVYWTVMKEDNLVPLSKIASTAFGTKTGANGFFYFKEDEEWKELGIDEKFIRPLLKHHTEMDFTSLREDELEWSVLDMNWFVEEKLGNNEDKESGHVKKKLKEEGYEEIFSYIEYGESEANKFHKRSTIEKRDVWFDLGDLPTPPLLIAKEYWKRLVSPLNTAGAAIDQRLYGVWPKDDVDPHVLGGVLNSSLFALMRELHGRIEQGEGMNRNTLAVYEAERTPIPDLSSLQRESRQEIRYSFEALIEAERSAAEDTGEAEDRLDRAVMSAIGMEDRTEDVQEAVELLLRVREEGAGQMTDVLVKSGDEMDSSLQGARRVEGDRGQMKLSL
jgi:type I restriction-modification system DNA methylase subunit